MPSGNLSSEILLLQDQLKSLTGVFDDAIQNDSQLGQLKEILQQIKILRTKLEELLYKCNTSYENQ
jgi:hypothetical protein